MYFLLSVSFILVYKQNRNSDFQACYSEYTPPSTAKLLEVSVGNADTVQNNKTSYSKKSSKNGLKL